ncbi:hypothetical protein KDL45_14055, partial [bacterium]|nr:hypothetical protein [bacterium]
MDVIGTKFSKLKRNHHLRPRWPSGAANMVKDRRRNGDIPTMAPTGEPGPGKMSIAANEKIATHATNDAAPLATMRSAELLTAHFTALNK